MFFDCNSDISAHLTSCHLSKCGDVTEGPLFLATMRAGISRLSATQVAGMTICSKPEVLPIPWSYWESCKCGGKTRRKLSKWTTKYAFCLAKAPLSDHVSTIFPFFFLTSIPYGDLSCQSSGGGRGGYSHMGFRPEHGFTNRRCHPQGKYGKPGIIFSGIFNTPNCRLATHPKKSDINL